MIGQAVIGEAWPNKAWPTVPGPGHGHAGHAIPDHVHHSWPALPDTAMLIGRDVLQVGWACSNSMSFMTRCKVETFVASASIALYDGSGRAVMNSKLALPPLFLDRIKGRYLFTAVTRSFESVLGSDWSTFVKTHGVYFLRCTPTRGSLWARTHPSSNPTLSYAAVVFSLCCVKCLVCVMWGI